MEENFEINDEKIEKEDEFNMALDCYIKDNPFRNILIATSFGLVGSYSTSVIAAGLSSAIYFGGHVFFTDTAFLVASGAKALTGIGLIVAIPLLIGSISFNIYRYFKSKSHKEYIEKLNENKNNSMKEEREIYERIFLEFKKYFQNNLENKYKVNKQRIIDYCKDIILKINQIKKPFITEELNEDIKKIENQITNSMFSLNILVIGSTGFGKSTLINEFLQLKNNKAPEGNDYKSMKIKLWPKKYPISENDSPIENINLYDTEGIEKSKKEGNDIESHFKKIKKFIITQEIFDNINAIWYCISGNRLDGDEEYINKILDMYKTQFKIPILFIYTKAYSTKEEEIESIKKGLQNIKYFKENPDNFHFIEIIAKNYVNKRGEIKEKKKGLNELFIKTIDLSKKSFKFEIYQSISQHYNIKAQNIIKNLSQILQEQSVNFIMQKKKFENFKDYIKDIFDYSYGDYSKKNNENIKEYSSASNNIKSPLSLETPLNSKNDIENEKEDIYENIENILKLIEAIKNEDLEMVIKSFNKTEDISNKVKDYIKMKYAEKVNKIQTFKDFNNDIEDYIINQLDTSKDMYGLYFLFDMLRDTILKEIIENLNKDFKNRKLETTKQLNILITEKIKEFTKQFNQRNFQI